MADASGLLALGQALDDYLVGEYSPTPGTQTALGFLAGVPVNPVTFQNNGVANPALVQAFLNLVVNKVAPVVDGRVAGSLLPAHQLFAALLAVGTPVAPPGTPAAEAYLAMKRMAGSAFGVLGAPKEVVTAPSNWYDPANTQGWSSFSMTTSGSSGTSAESTAAGDIPPPTTLPAGETPPIVAPERFEQLWQWRTPDPAAMAEVVMAAPEAVAPAPEAVGETVFTGALEIQGFGIRSLDLGDISVPADRSESAAARLIDELPLAASPQLMMRAFAAEPGVAEPVADDLVARIMATAPRLQLTDLVDAEPVLVTSEDSTVKSQAMAQLIDDQAPALTAALAHAEETTSTQTVDSNDLTLSLEYCFVQVSREWWNEVLIRMPGWYAPGLKAGDLVPGRHFAGLPVGVPVAMVVTRNVRVTGRWSAADHAAAASHANLGPWQMSGSEMSSGESHETATLTIPGMQVVAVVCSILSSIPPADDPAQVTAESSMASMLKDLGVHEPS